MRAIALAAVAVVATAPAASPQTSGAVAITHVSVIPMDRERILTDHTVVMRDGRIERIGPSHTTDVPPDARLIDGAGGFLLPGLTDAHIHLVRSRSASEELLRMNARMGVTAVTVLHGSQLALTLRDLAARGGTGFPRIVTSGPIQRQMDDTRQAGMDLVTQHANVGYDLVKVYNEVPRNAYYGIIDEARRRDITVLGHAVRSVGVEGAIETGQHIVHMEEIVYGYFRFGDSLIGTEYGRRPTLRDQLDPAGIAPLARRIAAAELWIIPNLVAYHWIQRQVEDLDAALDRPEIAELPEAIRNDWMPENNRYTRRQNLDRFLATLSTTFPFLQQLTKGFHEAGVRFMAGSDAPVPTTVPGYGLHEELQELVTAGLTPYEALVAATRHPAEFFGWSDAGTIAVGHRADLILLDGNPLQAIAATRDIRTVWIEGREVER